MNELAQRRVNGEPLQYLLGEWEFYGYPFKVGKGVLIPRAETEMLVDLAKKSIKENRLILDLCAGSGCVGIAIAKETGCNVIAVEKSKEAIYYLEQNIKLNNIENQVKIIQGDVLTMDFPLADCVLINPPYLSREDMNSLQKEVTYEPEIALYGGEDGLEFYRCFFDIWGKRIKNESKVALFACEVGDGQAQAVCGLIEKIGIKAQVMKDFNDIDRVVYCR